MDYILLISRLGSKIRKQRISRGLTQVQLAKLAGLTRYKIIAVEKGGRSVSMIAYARTLAALKQKGTNLFNRQLHTKTATSCADHENVTHIGLQPSKSRFCPLQVTFLAVEI